MKFLQKLAQAVGIAAVATSVALGAAKPPAAPPRPPDPEHLRAGEFVWHPEVAPEGPVVVVISLDEQRLFVYRNGVAIGLSTISSGRRGHETPPGVFTILQKDRVHHSNKYDNAPMPYMERLTWDGVALHGGTLPGYPASHGCVRLPQKFAERLFEITRRGETVVVANANVAPATIVHPAVLAPVGSGGEPLDVGAAPDPLAWNDAAAPDGPVSILVSTRDRRIEVLRNGVRIASATIEVADGFTLPGSLLFVMGSGLDDAPSPLDPSRPRHQWTMYALPSGEIAPLREDLATQLRVPPSFARRLYDVLVPGTTVLVTNLPAVRAPQVQTVLESAQ